MEDRKTALAVGFGLDQTRNDFKIVRILYACFFDGKPAEVEVYLLSANSWVGVSVECYALDQVSMAFVNGAVHWFACMPVLVLSFDFGSKEI